MPSHKDAVDGRRASVAVVGDRWLHGIVQREEQDEHVGLVYVVRFPSGHEARLTPKEVEIHG